MSGGLDAMKAQVSEFDYPTSGEHFEPYFKLWHSVDLLISCAEKCLLSFKMQISHLLKYVRENE